MDKIIYLYLVQLCLRRRINGAKEMEKRERKKDEREREKDTDSDRVYGMVVECWALLSSTC